MPILASKTSMVHSLDNKKEACTKWLGKISHCEVDLMALLELHKQMWAEGVRNVNFGPDRHGMFRASTIKHMRPEEVILGNVYGIFSNPISFFEREDIKYDEEGNLTDTYKKVFLQYRNHLMSNLSAMRSSIYDEGYDRNKLSSAILTDIDIATSGQGQECVILSETLGEGVLNVYFQANGAKNKSFVIVNDGEVYIPQSFLQGVRPDRNRIPEMYFHQCGKPGSQKRFTPDEVSRMRFHGIISEMSRKDLKDLTKKVETYQRNKGISFGI